MAGIPSESERSNGWKDVLARALVDAVLHQPWSTFLRVVLLVVAVGFAAISIVELMHVVRA